MTPDELFAKLSAPFPPDHIHWRVGSTNREKTKGMALAYLDARDVMDRLDTVMGPAYWQCRYPHANGKTVCEIGLALPTLTQPGQLEWIWKADGAGDTDHEAEKGALSDAFKRAAVRWGIGRYLYDLGNVWVEIEPFGKSYKIKEGEYTKLRRRLPNASQPSAPAQPGRAEQAGGELSPPASPSADEPTESQRLIFAALGLGIEKASTQSELEDFKETQIKPQMSSLTKKQQDDMTALYKDRYRSLQRRAA